MRLLKLSIMNKIVLQAEGMEVSTRGQLINQIRVEFNLQFGKKPDNITLTPGRINIIGEHTDYNNHK